jgi:hypothetical protein
MSDAAGAGVVVILHDPIGWERLGVIVDVRRARDAGLIRWHDGHAQARAELPADLRQRIDRHRDLLEHALTYDRRART